MSAMMTESQVTLVL